MEDLGRAAHLGRATSIWAAAYPGAGKTMPVGEGRMQTDENGKEQRRQSDGGEKKDVELRMGSEIYNKPRRRRRWREEVGDLAMGGRRLDFSGLERWDDGWDKGDAVVAGLRENRMGVRKMVAAGGGRRGWEGGEDGREREENGGEGGG
ncbi:hypothetical protein ACLOJK_026724 [Asimina triloba]